MDNNKKHEAKGYQIFVKTLTGLTVTLSGITPATPISDIAYHLQYKQGIPPDNQRLIFAGKQLRFGKLGYMYPPCSIC